LYIESGNTLIPVAIEIKALFLGTYIRAIFQIHVNHNTILNFSIPIRYIRSLKDRYNLLGIRHNNKRFSTYTNYIRVRLQKKTKQSCVALHETRPACTFVNTSIHPYVCKYINI
jgi:hypothetical protein